MAKNEHSAYQQKLISRYYANLDAIMLQKLGELVTDLYLADSASMKQKLWERAEKAMENLKIPPAIIQHIMQKKDIEVLAKNLAEWNSPVKK